MITAFIFTFPYIASLPLQQNVGLETKLSGAQTTLQTLRTNVTETTQHAVHRAETIVQMFKVEKCLKFVHLLKFLQP